MVTTQYTTLKNRGYRNGVTTRPLDTPATELSNFWPHTAGQEVPWVSARPVEALDNQRSALGWGLAGVLGNVDHRRKHGDHTPWSVISGVAKPRNVVWAIDISDPTYLEEQLLALCRMPDYDTSWIHFFNINGSQYDHAGNRIASSGDYHLHVSVKSSAWDRYHTLGYDIYRRYKGWPLLNGQQVPNPLDPIVGDDVTAQDVWIYDPNDVNQGGIRNPSWRPDAGANPTVKPSYAVAGIWDEAHEAAVNTRALRAGQEAILAALQGLDTTAVLARIDQYAAAEGQRDAALLELVKRGLSGELAAAEVVRLMGERLRAGVTP